MDLRAIKGFKGNVKLPDNNLIVLFGQNNSGKTSILLSINKAYGNSSDYISPLRFNISNSVTIDHNFDNQIQRAHNDRSNYSPNRAEVQAPDAIKEIFNLDDHKREKIKEWHNRYFGKLSIKRSDEKNRYSPPEIRIDGLKPTQQGSGSRAVLSILVKLLDPDLEVLCIDEPELSIEPKTQRILFDLIKQVSEGKEDLPQKKIILATHSHIFIDKFDYQNNFKVVNKYLFKKPTLENIIEEKEYHQSLDLNREAPIIDPPRETIFLQVKNEGELQQSVYDLLGGSPADLFFPSNIIIVEGKSDEVFLKRIYELMVAKGDVKQKKLAFHYAGGYDKTKYSTESIIQIMKTQSYIPVYKDKICGIFDKPNKKEKLIREIRDFVGDDEGNRFILLSKKAIEYYYPLNAVQKTLGGRPVTPKQLEKEVDKFLTQYKSQGDGDFFHFKSIKKVDLSHRVCSHIDNYKTVNDKIIKLIKHAVSISY
ncbi:ABC-type Mn2+/Zn2+ transport system, ATPase component [Fodinibius roseus]|uniref:ABC-type Mn2+/Zn2+ transport system, ATPase component n=1 Tax=Fodinibius roseus TaxID=1194090 RepID=A0A1M5LQH2_9BACT|nr:AAA family ATPase [Fodinibius roseus]SHG67392.1 ABC-type Mn2+/Zn2+ transport system, ATPase component [Fodinibius roseus]